MSNIAIMTDSNCGIMPDEGRDLGIYVLPMPVIIDGQTYYEGVDITLDEFFKKQTEGADITTSQPSPGDVEAMWTELLKTHDEVLFVPMSGGLSNTCQTALMLSGEDEFAGRVFVVNNRRISVTQAQSVLDAKLLAEEGKTASEIKEILEAEALDASIYIAVDTLEYLKKGGRITAAAAAIGTVLKLKPVLTIQGDKLDSFAKARGLKAAFRIMLNAVKNENFDAIVLSGGPGTYDVMDNSELLEILVRHRSRGAVIAAICAAPLVLCRAGILDGSLKCTGHTSILPKLGNCNASALVVSDSRVITSQGAGTAVEFALEIVRELEGGKVSNEVAKSICFIK